MNKSKFLKRSLAALLAILMVATMIPSVFAAGEDAPEIFVDNRRATYDGTKDYAVTIYDTDDVLISWTPKAGVKKMQVVTRHNVVKDLDAKIYLPENASFDGKDTYTITIREIKDKNTTVDHILSITIKSTKPTNECRLGGVRVDKTSGWYKLGYLGGDNSDTSILIPGYSNPVTKKGIEAHAISGEIVGNKVIVTLPFGMTPRDVGFDSAISGPSAAQKAKATAVFAPMSVVAKSEYTYYGDNKKTGSVTVTAQSGATRTYGVEFKSEQVFDSFKNATNLDDLTDVTKIESNPTNGQKSHSMYTLQVSPDYNSDGVWIPEFETTKVDGVDRAQRIMGLGYKAMDSAISNPTLVKLSAGKGGHEAVKDGVASINTAAGDSRLRLVTSKNAKWDAPANSSNNPDYVYLLVRTKANPSGAFVEVELTPGPTGTLTPWITELQAANTMSNENAAFVPTNATSIDVTLSKEFGDINIGGAGDNDDGTDKARVTLHVSTATAAHVRVPSQENNSSPVEYDRDTTKTHHVIKNLIVKESVTIQVYDPLELVYRNYTVNFRVADTNYTELDRVALVERNNDGTMEVVAESIKGSSDKAPRELEIPFKYYPDTEVNEQKPDDRVYGHAGDLKDLYLFITTSDGATVIPGNFTGEKVKEYNYDIDNPLRGLYSNPSNGSGRPSIIENGVTKLKDVWLDGFMKGGDNTAVTVNNANFDDTLMVTVTNSNDATPKNYEIILKRMHPETEAEIEEAQANRALDKDYIYAQGNSLGLEEGTTDVGQAYITARDKKGNDLPTRIDGKNIIVTVPNNWNAASDSLFLTKLEKSDLTTNVYRRAGAADNDIIEISKSVLASPEQKDQSKSVGAARTYDQKEIEFKDLTPVGTAARDKNVLYAVSERAYWGNFSGSAPTTLAGMKTYATAYNVHIERTAANDTIRDLAGVTTDDAAKATVNFDHEYGMIDIEVPESTNWSDGYRADDSRDFKLNFTKTTGALIIDKGQHDENNKTAGSTASTNGAGVTDGRYAGKVAPTKIVDALAEYKFQLNERDQITDDTTFFVLNGELWIYDPLTGYETQVTGIGGDFTNDNWATIKTKQAEIQVYDEDQNDMITYRLNLKVGPSQATSGDATLSSVTVNGYTAVKSGNDYTVTVPEDTDLTAAALTLAATDSKVKSITVNGATYSGGMTLDLSKAATIVVTAENGKTETYTLTAKTGDVTPPKPDEKPSDKYTDIPNDVMGESIKKAIDEGIMVGTSATKFSPNMTVSRWQFALLIARADLRIKNSAITNAGEADAELLKQYSGTPKFSDAKKEPLYNAAIEYCNKNGIIDGKGNNKFDPNGNVTRLEAARMISDWTGITDATKTENTNGVKDWNKVNWGKEYVNAVYDAGFITGYPNGNFGPKDNLKRSQAAVIIMKAYEYMTNK